MTAGRSNGGAAKGGVLVGLLLVSAPALAGSRPSPAPTPAALQPVYACRQEPDPTRRLACYDAAVGNLATAESTGDVQVLDQDAIRETKRKLFGFDRLHLPALGGGKHAGETEVDRVEGVVASADRDRDGHWVLVLEDGARWRQTDDVTLGRWPRKGNAVTVERGALGSFRMRVAGQPPIKVQREG